MSLHRLHCLLLLAAAPAAAPAGSVTAAPAVAAAVPAPAPAELLAANAAHSAAAAYIAEATPIITEQVVAGLAKSMSKHTARKIVCAITKIDEKLPRPTQRQRVITRCVIAFVWVLWISSVAAA